MTFLLATYRKFVALTGMGVMGTLMCLIRFLSFGKAVPLNRKVIAPFFSRLILWLLGVRVTSDLRPLDEKVIYMFNHNSFLDILIIPLLGLKRTRYIISEGVQSIIPLHLCNIGLDVLYIPTQDDSIRRVEFFKQVTNDLRDNKYSVICAPEGQHTFSYGISTFNKGVFHMATLSKRKIQPLLINVPQNSDPLESLNMSSCLVHVSSKDLISTLDWTENDLVKNKEMVKEKFISYYEEMHGKSDKQYVHHSL